MKTQEILSIIALSLLGLCLLSGLVKMTMKNESHKKPYEQGCAASVFIAVVLLGISQLLTEREPYDDSICQQWRKCNPRERKSGICLDSDGKKAGPCESGCCMKPGFRATLTAGKLTKVYCDPTPDPGDPNYEYPCYYEKTLTDCLKNSGCTKEKGKRATGGQPPRGYNTQECEVCPNGQLLCGPCPP